MKIIAILALFVCTHAYSQSAPMSEPELKEYYDKESHKQATILQNSMQRLYDHAYKVDEAIDSAIKTAVLKLDEAGLRQDARRIEYEWTRYTGFVVRGVSRGIGDHAAVVFLYDIWFFLNLTLGQERMEFFHLDDLYIFSYTIPVVFWCDDDVDSPEYKTHFVALGGATAYWTAMLSCSIALYGTFYSLVCSPAGVACEYLVSNTVAPWCSDFFWKISCRR